MEGVERRIKNRLKFKYGVREESIKELRKRPRTGAAGGNNDKL